MLPSPCRGRGIFCRAIGCLSKVVGGSMACRWLRPSQCFPTHLRILARAIGGGFSQCGEAGRPPHSQSLGRLVCYIRMLFFPVFCSLFWVLSWVWVGLFVQRDFFYSPSDIISKGRVWVFVGFFILFNHFVNSLV